MGGGGIGVDTEVGVLHRAQLALQQDLPAVGQGGAHKGECVAHKGGYLLPVAHEELEQLLGVEQGLVIQMLKEHILDGADVLQPVHQEGFVVQLTDLNADLGVLIRIEGGDARFGGAERIAGQPLLFIGVLEHMIGHQKLRALGDNEMRGGHAAGLQLPQFLHEFGDIQRHAVADDVSGVGIEDSGGELVQGEFTVIADDGVPGVGPTLEADDYVGCFCEHVGDLALALVAPVGADDRFDHKNSSCIFGLRSSFQDMLLYPKVP